ncbi:MAG: Gldg family protein [Lachnospiraceae bacterium]|nr:Gldg family protein [Lachnospiraceae bacterium]
MTAIFKREFKSYFDTVIGWLFIASTIALLDLYFVVYNLFAGYPYTSYVVSSVVILFMISIPILTMRILAEERKNKTDQLMLTAPVKVSGIVIGKFLALAAIFSITVLVACLFPLVMSLFGTIPFAECYVSILGFALYGYACIAIGIFVSSITESQVIAAVVTFAALFMCYIMNSLCSMISETGNMITRVLRIFDMSSRYQDLMDGTLNMADVVYFLTFVVLFLFLTVQSIQKRRFSVSVKSLALGAYSSGMVVIAIAAAIILNMVVGQLPERFISFDVSGTKMYTISQDTIDLVSALDQDVKIYVLTPESSVDTRVQKTLNRYADESEHVSIEYIDPAINPRFVSQFTSETVSQGSLVITCGDKSRVIDANDLYVYTMDYSTYQSTVTGYDAEGQITSAIAYVTSEDNPKIYALIGHGETDLETTYTSAIAKENIDYESINLMQYDAVPEDAEAIIINGPTADFNTDDADKVLSYLANGGKAYILASWTDVDMTNFNRILGEFGLSVDNAVIIEGDSDHYAQNVSYLLPDVSSDELTDGVAGNGYVFAPFALPIIEKEDDAVTLTDLLTTSDRSFARTDVNNQSETKEEGDTDGPFTIGVKAVRTYDDKEGTMLLYSSINLMNESANSMVSGNNLKLFTNALAQFVDHESSISIPAKDYQLSSLIVDQRYIMIISAVSVILIPVALLIAGFVIWFKRRKK